ncbi:MAG: AsmA family protein, partial [Pontibacterium sp.]
AIAIDIESVAFTNGTLSYQDQVAGTRAVVEALNLTTGNIVAEKSFPVELSLVVKQFADASNTPSLTAAVNLQSQARFNLETLTVWLNELTTTTDVSGSAFAKPLSISLGGDLVASPAQLVISKLQLAVANLKADGNLDISNFAAPIISGDIAIGSFALNELMAALGQPAIETTDPSVLKNIAAELTLDGTANLISIPKLAVRLDETRFTGNLAYALDSGAIIANIAGDKIDADRYLPPASGEQTAASQPPASSGEQPLYSKEDVVPVELIKSLNLDTTFTLNSLRINKLDMQDVDIAVTVEKGVLNAKRLNLDMYQGQLRNSVVVNTNKSPVALSINKSVKGVQIGDMLKAMADTDMLTGAINSSAKLTARGTSVHDIVHSLNGSTSTTMDKGELKGIDMAYTVCQGLNTVGSLGINTQDVDRSTPFADLRANTKIVNGVVTNPDLKASLDAMALTGNGQVNLPNEDFNYKLGLTIESNLFNKSCSIPDFIEGVKLPVICKAGFFDEPVDMCRPDLSGFRNIFKAQTEAKVNAEIKKQREKAKAALEEKVTEKLGDDAKSLLKGLFR